MGSSEAVARPVGDDRRSRRQSRLTREIVSTQGLLYVEWSRTYFKILILRFRACPSRSHTGMAKSIAAEAYAEPLTDGLSHPLALHVVSCILNRYAKLYT